MVKFTARRSLPELVAPARPTPLETKVLSDVDDCYDLRVYSFGIEFFRCRPGGHPTTTPAKAVKVALAEALVYYYPMAGRLREILPTNKLVVDCAGEGVVFVEASADVGLEEFGNPSPRPPYPCIEELLCDAGDIKVVVDKPLFFVQVSPLVTPFLIAAPSSSLCLSTIKQLPLRRLHHRGPGGQWRRNHGETPLRLPREWRRHRGATPLRLPSITVVRRLARSR
ncbi:hypothetical protein ACQJBY_062833 [Aegilops geniculata]